MCVCVRGGHPCASRSWVCDRVQPFFGLFEKSKGVTGHMCLLVAGCTGPAAVWWWWWWWWWWCGGSGCSCACGRWLGRAIRAGECQRRRCRLLCQLGTVLRRASPCGRCCARCCGSGGGHRGLGWLRMRTTVAICVGSLSPPARILAARTAADMRAVPRAGGGACSSKIPTTPLTCAALAASAMVWAGRRCLRRGTRYSSSRAWSSSGVIHWTSNQYLARTAVSTQCARLSPFG